MNKIIAAIVLLSTLLISNNVYAEGTELTKENIQGSWRLDYTEKSGNTNKREDTWTFKNNGMLTITHIPREGGFYDQSPVKYEINDNKLKVSILGRAGKFDKFSLINISEKIMVLKARFGDIYRFIKK